MTQTHLDLDEAFDLAYTHLFANGCDGANATACAARMVEAERDGCASHGLFRLPWYVQGVKSGRVNGHASPTVRHLAPGVVRVDGDGGFAPLGQQIAHGPLVECAKKQGIAALAFTNMFHIAAMWPEVEALANDGLCALAMTASYPYVVPAGGIKALFGTNPIGFAWPRAGAAPLVFDQASAAMARGEIQIAAREGKSVPVTAGIGPDGAPTTDPNLVLEGAQLGFGGYKGAALAMMVELLAGPLIGEMLSFEAEADDAGRGGPPKGGELMIALDPALFGDAAGVLAHGEKLIMEILAQDGTRLPGERRLQQRHKSDKEGVQIPTSLYQEIQALGL